MAQPLMHILKRFCGRRSIVRGPSLWYCRPSKILGSILSLLLGITIAKQSDVLVAHERLESINVSQWPERVRFDGNHDGCKLSPLQTTKDAPQEFWTHLDADVLDDAIMPAVDYRLGWPPPESESRRDALPARYP